MGNYEVSQMCSYVTVFIKCVYMQTDGHMSHLCPPEDIVHSCGPRLCPPCSSTSPGWGGWAARARSPWPRTLSGSTGPAQLETLTEETTGFHLGMRIPLFWNKKAMSFRWIFSEKQKREKSRKGPLLTNTSIPVQHQTGLAGTFEAAQRVQTVSVLTDTLHGALIDIFKVGRYKNEKVILIYCRGWYLFRK